jgi:ribosomal protein L37AE/L43A
MNTRPNYWLLLEKSDETRVSGGIDPYRDKTGEQYHYDSAVANARKVKSGDYAILRKENTILGIAEIGYIDETRATKTRRRCPYCNTTDIRERTTKLPKWKCGRCTKEFSTPKDTVAEVTSFVAEISHFNRLEPAPSVKSVKRCAATGNGATAQNSIIKLDGGKLKNLLEELEPGIGKGSSGQGFGLSIEERKAVELLAMETARKLYENKGWRVVDMSASTPYDLLATRGTQKRYIRVKGSTGMGEAVILTHGEVAHAKAHPADSALVVVSGIILHRENDKCIASGGEIRTHQHPWVINDTSLTATQYRYELSMKPGSSLADEQLRDTAGCSGKPNEATE